MVQLTLMSANPTPEAAPTKIGDLLDPKQTRIAPAITEQLAKFKETGVPAGAVVIRSLTDLSLTLQKAAPLGTIHLVCVDPTWREFPNGRADPVDISVNDLTTDYLAADSLPKIWQRAADPQGNTTITFPENQQPTITINGEQIPDPTNPSHRPRATFTPDGNLATGYHLFVLAERRGLKEFTPFTQEVS